MYIKEYKKWNGTSYTLKQDIAIEKSKNETMNNESNRRNILMLVQFHSLSALNLFGPLDSQCMFF